MLNYMCRQSRKKNTDKDAHHRVNEGSCDKATLKEREDGKLTTSSGRLFHKLQTDTKKGVLKGGSSGKWNMNCMRVMSPRIRMRKRGEICGWEMMDCFRLYACIAELPRAAGAEGRPVQI